MSRDRAADTVDGLALEGAQRVDRWLWAARFFKTRSRARAAVRAGKVALNGARAKPARQVRVGDRVDVATPAGRFVVDVDALNEQRRPAQEARQLYTETAESRAARERERANEQARRAAVVFDEGRPDRRERRASIRWRKRQGGP
ncbi:MAG: RNA-binding protein [Proteobacteria bacterium SW_6_67_9]|nr:MAG: RNA-binding protein [Proteobacteria bacterium SW_6_67_9]